MITRSPAYKPVQHVYDCNDVDTGTTMTTHMSSLYEPHKHDVSCHWTGVGVERKEEGNWAYVGISISPNEYFKQSKDLEESMDVPPVRRWYKEAAPEEFKDLWTGVLEDDRMLEVHLVQSELEIETVEAYKYKPVGKKVHPVPGVIQEATKVRRQIPEDPLKTLPDVPTHPPDFKPTERFTVQRMKEMSLEDNEYLLPEEHRLFQHVLLQNERTITWAGELPGKFRNDYFSPYIFPVVPHEPWATKQIHIPPGLYDK
jgi:hypothetical protein